MKRIIIITICCFIGLSAYAQTDTIRLQDKRLNVSNLKPGLNQYLVYFQNPKNKQSLRFWFWLRNIQLESRDGQKVFAITQHWYGSDSAAYRSIYSLNSAEDFAPVYISLTIKGVTIAYNWSKTKITGADNVANNAH
mgnify:FL=1